MNRSRSSGVPGACVPRPSVSLLMVRRCFTPMFFAALAACTREPTGTVTPTEHGVPVAAAPAPAPPLRADVVELLNELLVVLPAGWCYGDEMPRPQAFERLIELGGDALPTLLHLTEATHDDVTLHMLLAAIARIDGTRALSACKRLLGVGDGALRRAAMAALVGVGSAEALRMLKDQPDYAEAVDRIELRKARLRLGDGDAVPELLRLGFSDPKLEEPVAQALAWYAPLRQAARFEDPPSESSGPSFDEGLFLRFADDWYHRVVLHQRSPWASTAPDAIGPPFATARRDAFRMLLDCMGMSGVPMRAKAPSQGPEFAQRPALRALLAEHHSHGTVLRVLLAETHGEASVLHVFQWYPLRSKIRFPGDNQGCFYSCREMTTAAYDEVVAGLHTILEAKMEPWWEGPWSSFSSSNSQRAVAIDGITATARRACFSGVGFSSEPDPAVTLEAASRWFDLMLERHAPVTMTVCSPAARTAFSAWFREQFLVWQGEPAMTSWEGWLRQQVVAMAADAGDASLVVPLRHFLDARYRDGGRYGVPAAASAVNALARLTGIELRYEADGKARPLGVVAGEYERALADAVQSPR